MNSTPLVRASTKKMKRGDEIEQAMFIQIDKEHAE